MMKQNDLFGRLPVEEPVDGKVCIKCNVKKPADHFSPSSGRPYPRSECKECNRKLSKIRKELREKYGEPPEGYECPICSKSIEDVKWLGGKGNMSFVVDHCHDTDTFRGWLCHNCNRGLGIFYDDSEMLKRAIDYLEGKS